MSNVTIQLSDDRMRDLQSLAKDANVPVEELLRARVEEWLSAKQDFLKAATYVLKKNEELYRRLA